jgi:ABC-type branched-subunit amino acid transport system permease subunit
MIPIGLDGYRQDYRLLRTAGHGVAVVLVAAVAAWLPSAVSAQTLEILNRAAIAAIGAIGLNLLTGTCGLISIGHAGFLALGGMVAAILSQIPWLPFSAGARGWWHFACVRKSRAEIPQLDDGRRLNLELGWQDAGAGPASHIRDAYTA